MAKIKFRMEVQRCTEQGVPEGNPWIEDYSYSLEDIVLGFAKNMVNEFNHSRREGEPKRKLNDVTLT